MWLAVIERQVLDSCTLARLPDAQRRREQARAWLTTRSTGLHTVLAVVGFEPDWWHAALVPQLRRSWETPGRPRRTRWDALPAPAAP